MNIALIAIVVGGVSFFAGMALVWAIYWTQFDRLARIGRKWRKERKELKNVILDISILEAMKAGTVAGVNVNTNEITVFDFFGGAVGDVDE